MKGQFLFFREGTGLFCAGMTHGAFSPFSSLSPQQPMPSYLANVYRNVEKLFISAHRPFGSSWYNEAMIQSVWDRVLFVHRLGELVIDR